jgi:hypothetical protein
LPEAERVAGGSLAEFQNDDLTGKVCPLTASLRKFQDNHLRIVHARLLREAIR